MGVVQQATFTEEGILVAKPRQCRTMTIYVLTWPFEWWFDNYLVGGFNPTPLKNDGVRQWEGWHAVYEMEKKIHVPNHQPATVSAYFKQLGLTLAMAMGENSSMVSWKDQPSSALPCGLLAMAWPLDLYRSYPIFNIPISIWVYPYHPIPIS